MADTTAECPICASSYTGTVRKAVACENRETCGFRACLQCYCSYLTETPHLPHCMECKAAWTYDYVCGIFTQNFRESVLRKKRKELYYERERSLLPATQEKMNYFERKARLEESLRMQYRYRTIGMSKRYIRNELYLFWKDEGFPLFDKKAIRLYGQPTNRREGETEMETERAVIHHGACPNGDCNGFINVRYHCTLCKSVICKECHRILRNSNNIEVEGEALTTHQCNEDDKASVRLLQAETKPCPKCRARIYKVDGCNQVYCIHCETAFNWATGKIDTGPVHTPDYFRRLRERGIAQQNAAERAGAFCNNAYTNYSILHQFIINMSSYYYVLVEKHWTPHRLNSIYQLFHHLIDEVILRYYAHTERETEINESLREEYLKKKCSLDSFKRRIYTHYQQNDRNGELQGIRTMIEPIMNEILAETISELHAMRENELKIIEGLFERFEAFRTFINDAFINVYKKYGLQVPFVEPDWSSSTYSDGRKPKSATAPATTSAVTNSE